MKARICETCGCAMTDREIEDYVDQCGPCVFAEQVTADEALRFGWGAS